MQQFQPTLPKGSDLHPRRKNSSDYQFQPTLPKGSDGYELYNNGLVSKISTHTPQRE